MFISRNFQKIGLGVIALGMAMHGNAFAAADLPRSMELTFDIYLGGFQLASSTVSLNRENTSYRMTATSKTQGFLDNFIHFNNRSESSGVWDVDGPRPDQFSSNSESDWGDYVLEMVYRNNKPVVVKLESSSEDEEEERESVPEAMKIGTIDPLTASMVGALMGGLGDNNSGKCAVKVPSFNGRVRGDFIGDNVGPDYLTPDDVLFYEGEAYECSVAYKVLAGGRKDWMKDEAEEPTPPGQLWLADFSGHMLPVRFQLDHRMGNVVAHLVGLKVNGAQVAIVDNVKLAKK